MIYERLDKTDPVRQGDIFYPLPLTVLNLGEMAVLSEVKLERSNWQQVKDRRDVVVNVPVKPTWGIVATQGCDALRVPIISLFEIGTFKEVSRLQLPSKPKKWVDLITQKSRLNARWFYLPSDDRIGFNERMAINFHVVFQILREDLEQHVGELRRGRLNKVAFQHYRESIAQYFRRYPYDEWYPLTKDELMEYNEVRGPVEPFGWQK